MKFFNRAKKLWKQYTTSAVFIGLAGLFASKGIDLSLYVDSIEAVYAVLATAYAGLMAAFDDYDERQRGES